jgi:hypothetical protein
MLTYISNSTHFSEDLSLVPSVHQTLWISKADIKDFNVDIGKEKGKLI